ncbi:MAG: hypothetical protein M1381_02790 [Deltaproteobacteria bacterium]|nr:hypothetical protein [Deltaproteobacteria bacterium]MCL5791991.1 hypothetical protein [Deltaproteobacteria bacterium]
MKIFKNVTLFFVSLIIGLSVISIFNAQTTSTAATQCQLPHTGAAYNSYLYAFGGYPITQTSGGVYTTQSSFTTTVEYTKIYP